MTLYIIPFGVSLSRMHQYWSVSIISSRNLKRLVLKDMIGPPKLSNGLQHPDHAY